MKYYSEVLKKMFDKEDELKTAEAEFSNRESNKAKDEAEIDKMADALVEKVQEYTKKYKKLPKRFQTSMSDVFDVLFTRFN